MPKKVKPIPKGYHSLSPYLIVKNGAKAIDFYKKAFHAEVMSRCDSPQGYLLHAELKIGDSLFMLSDENPGPEGCGVFSPQTLEGTCIMLHLYVTDVDATFTHAIKCGAKVLREPTNMFWGDRYCQIEDPFGHRWSIATHIEDLTPQEIEERITSCKSCG